MKKAILISLIALAVIINPKVSSSQAFQRGDNIIGAAIGFGGTLVDYTYGSQTPAISAQYEHGIWDVGGPGVISLGGYLGYKSYSYSFDDPYYAYNYSQTWSYTIIGVRGTYHYNGLNIKQLDLYGGVMISYEIIGYKYTSNIYDPYYNSLYNSVNYPSTIWPTVFAGARYFLSDKFAFYGELGYGIAFINLGACLKL